MGNPQRRKRPGYLDGPAIGLMAGCELLSVESVPADDYTYICSVICRFGGPAKLIFAWVDPLNYCYMGISSIPTGAKNHLSLFMVLDGKEEKLAENPIFSLPYGATMPERFRIHVKNDDANLLIEADREGNGIPDEIRAGVTKREALDKSHGGRVGIFNCWTGTPGGRTFLIYDTVHVEGGRVDADPL